MVSLLSIGIVSFIVGIKDAPRLLGFPFHGIVPWFSSVVISFTITFSLFLGPASERAIKMWRMRGMLRTIGGGSSSVTATIIRYVEFAKVFVLFQTPRTPLVPTRNLIVAPLFEEFVFRSCMCAILYAGGVSLSDIILFSPLVFGLAHVHHALEAIVRFKQPWKQQILRATLQTAYTTLFGIFAAFLLIRTGHFVAPFVSHMFCNSMGLPSLEFLFRPDYDLKDYRKHIAFLFFFGIVLFVFELRFLVLYNPSFLRSVYWDVERTYI